MLALVSSLQGLPLMIATGRNIAIGERISGSKETIGRDAEDQLSGRLADSRLRG